MKMLKELDLKGKRVFLRADLNVPLQDKKILQDYRLEKILPTIDYIIKNGGKVILATHIGRPSAEKLTNFFDENLSTKILVPWFENKGYKIRYKIDLEKAKIYSHENFKEILLLENLRFFNGEQGTIQERETFAQILRQLADVYVNDAFALAHRDDTSVILLPKLFKDKANGLLVEQEITQLTKIKKNVKQPFMVIIGGNKIETKIPLLKSFIQNKTERPSTILIGGAIANTFLNKNKQINETEKKFAQDFLKLAQEENIKILLPIDQSKNDIGPKSIESFSQEIKKAKTIFINGTMGIYENINSQTGTKEILTAIAQSNAFTVAGGGDCIAAIYKFNLQDKFNFLSTGGGATLAFLANEKLNFF
ncbi:MAG: phosphoglycerate kinase [bacterium]